jgi:hypothetical protein
MSASDAFASDVPYRGVVWSKLRMSDYGQLENAVRAQRNALVRALVKECGITGPESFGILNDQLKPVTYYNVNEYLFTREGAEKALTLSLARKGVEGDALAAAIEPLDMVTARNLAAYLTGFRKSIEDEGAPVDGEHKPDPQGA